MAARVAAVFLVPKVADSPVGWRLAEDILRVIDAVAINNPVVIGHSFAGEEMHVLGARHSAKTRGLVYVDAAFDFRWTRGLLVE